MINEEKVRKTIEFKVANPVNRRIYWERKAESEKLERVEKTCHDCAITTGFYTPFADELLEYEHELQDKVLDGWTCHNDCNKCCRGAYNYIQMKRKKEAQDGE